MFVLHILLIAFVTIFTYFGPAVVCLFSATEVTHEGNRRINLKGASPIGFRSLLGNYFFSTDHTIWHTARKIIMRTVLLPILFLAPAVFVENLLNQNLLPQQNVLRISHLFQPFRGLCYGCYCIQGFYLHFLMGKPRDAERSCVFYASGDDLTGRLFMWICSHPELPKRIMGRLRAVWWFLVHLCRLIFIIWPIFFLPVILFACWPIFLVMAPSFYLLYTDKASPLYVLFICLLAFFAWITLSRHFGFVWLFEATLLLSFKCLFAGWGFAFETIIALSFPVTALCVSTDIIPLWQLIHSNCLHRYLLFAARLIVVFLDIFVSCLSALGVMFVLRSAAVGVTILIQLAVSYVLSAENLPFLTCCVVVSYYL